MSRLNYHHLYYFWRVASEGNLSRTAEQLHVSQSALSAQIRTLEESTGANLFDRQGRSLVLTETGREVLRYAQDIFARGEELESFLKSGAAAGTTLLRVGMLSTLSRNFIDRLITPLLIDPTVHLVVEAAPLENLLTGLSKHQLDLVLTNADVRGGDEQLWQSKLLAQQPIAIIGPPISGRKPRFPNGFRELSWVLPSRGSEIRKAFDSYCSSFNFRPNVVAEANDMPMLRLLARDSGAVTVLPPVVVGDELRRGTLQEYRQLPGVGESFYAITIRRNLPSPVVDRLLSQPIQWQLGD